MCHNVVPNTVECHTIGLPMSLDAFVDELLVGIDVTRILVLTNASFVSKNVEFLEGRLVLLVDGPADLNGCHL